MQNDLSKREWVPHRASVKAAGRKLRPSVHKMDMEMRPCGSLEGARADLCRPIGAAEAEVANRPGSRI